ncbi:uncharacterized protein FIBRA_09005 [Fibroporia radiculosa]|uniref:Uncharacterized protein n=1 Tax=Fibroporia radiculosa TaxID=599839 RepID=J4GXS3_9APHY|nr:uncharacterized protein FIBRA_09005 [Fibroporia radiculosa]CCM06715.1 predicted protein [Fibroporia radiculosa]
MASSTFTTSNAIDMSKEREWAANLGMLDWDNTRIVFTKRSLLEFLKSVGVTVDPNFTNVQKLPRYAHFGTLSEEFVEAESAEAEAASSGLPQTSYRPSRRVRTAPGGSHSNIFGIAEDDALANAPTTQKTEVVTEKRADIKLTPEEDNNVEPDVTVQDSRPKSKRTTSSGVAGLWDAPNPDEFKPTRRVRERPGGKDSIADLF